DLQGVTAGDGEDAILVEIALLGVQEKEGVVFDDGAAERAAEDGLGARRYCLSERVGSVEALVAEIAVGSAVKVVATAACNEVEVAAEGAPELCLAAGGDDLQFRDGLDGQRGLDKAGGVVVGREAVDEEGVGEVALRVDGEALARDGRSFGEELGRSGVGGGYAGREEREIEEVTRDKGKLIGLGW